MKKFIKTSWKMITILFFIIVYLIGFASIVISVLAALYHDYVIFSYSFLTELMFLNFLTSRSMAGIWKHLEENPTTIIQLAPPEGRSKRSQIKMTVRQLRHMGAQLINARKPGYLVIDEGKRQVSIEN